MTLVRAPTFVISSQHVLGTGCTLGECPVWDDRLACLWWTDIQESRLLRWDWDTRTVTVMVLPERLGAFGLTDDPEWLVAAFASGFALYHPATGRRRWIARIALHDRGIRLNDGRVDPAGRFWAGSMVEDAARAQGARGSLYRLDGDGRVHRMKDGIMIANGICFVQGGRVMHFADSPTRRIMSFQVAQDGHIQQESLFATVPPPGVPDGADSDAQGMVWNAEWGAGRITCYRLDGTIAQQIMLPVSQPTCVAFGGPLLDHLFVTSAREGLPPEQDEPMAGDILVYQLATPGTLAPRFPLHQMPLAD